MSHVEKRSGATIEEYFAYEESIEGLAEYYDGEIFDMSGGSRRHNRISMNLAHSVENRLDQENCETFNGDFRLAIEAAGSFVRPDFWVICGPIDPFQDRDDTARNAMFVAEVQSPSTTLFDRTGKFERYLKLPTLREFVLLEQDAPKVDVYFLNDQGIWEFQTVTDIESEVRFRSLGISVQLREIYKKVVFPKG